VAQGKEPLYPYSVAALMAVLGRSPWVMRLTSAMWGLLLVAATYSWVRRAFDTEVALLTAAGLAVGFWPVTTSRLGLRAIALPVMFAASAGFLWCAIGRWARERKEDRHAGSLRHSVAQYLLSGLALGLSLYTYLAARLMPAVLLAFLVYLLVVRRDVGRRAWRGILLILAVAALVSAPLFLYLRAHPSAEVRVGQLDRPLRALQDGDPSLLLGRARETIQMLSFRGDTFVPYNLPGKPLLGPAMSILFYSGLVLALWRWRRPAHAFALFWLAAGLAPALATGIEAANLRAIAAQPVLYLFPALSLVAAGRFVRVRGRNSQRTRASLGSNISRALVPTAVALFALVAAMTFRDYYLRWAEDRDVRVHYHVDLVAIADAVRRWPDDTIAISALYPGQYHDARVVEAVLGEVDDRMRWFDSRGGLPLPAADSVIYIVSPADPIDPLLQAFFAPDLTPVHRVALRPDDLRPGFDVFRWNGSAALPDQPVASVGDQLVLLQAELHPDQARAGENLDLITVWQIAGQLPSDRDAVIFAQLLDSEARVIVQQDRLDVPSWNWQVGDRFAQLFQLALPGDMAGGGHRVIVGVYTVPDRVDAVLAGHEPDPAAPRLAIAIDGEPAGDYLQLQVEVLTTDE
jgi:4-amino-4-deoxy-L-arabinose transferase-like glycosyltransferase